MTTIRVSGPSDEIQGILEIIRSNVPHIMSEKEYTNEDFDTNEIRVYFTISEELQRASKENLQDWAIIEYCSDLRTTSEIMRYFQLPYPDVKEILTRLFESGDLVRELSGKTYRYYDAKKVVWCKDCVHFNDIKHCPRFDRPSENDWNTLSGFHSCSYYSRRD